MLQINVSPSKDYIVGGKNADVVTFKLTLVGNDIVLYGNETYLWDFGETGQPQLTGSGPHTIFYRNSSGPSGYDVNVTVYQKLTPVEAGTNGTSGQTDFYYNASTTVYVYSFDSEIIGPDYVLLNDTVIDSAYSISHGQFDNGNYYPQAVLWELDGEPLAQNGTDGSQNWYPNLTSAIEQPFTEIRNYVLSAKITHGVQTKKLVLNITVTLGNQVFGFRSLTDATPDLMFFNKEGDHLNFNYQQDTDGKYKWFGDMIFDPNSNDTFKTIGLYTFEKVAPITYTTGALTLSKFQFFNEFGIDFLSESTLAKSGLVIDNIEPVINRTGFMSKWIYGNNFHTIFQKGSDVWFENVTILQNNVNANLSDFDPIVLKTNDPIWNANEYISDTQRRRLWSVIDTKPDAIMVISDTDNNTWFNNNYKYDTINKGQIFSTNFIRIWYPLNFPISDFSNWNESWTTIEGTFYNERKITVVNSSKNSSVYSINFQNGDEANNKYLRKFLKLDCLTKPNLPPGHGFEITLNFKTNKVFLGRIPVNFIPSSGPISPFLNQKDLIIFDAFNNVDQTPPLLTEGVEFVFEDDGVTVNFSKIYTVLQRDIALNVLEANETDRKGWTLTTLNIDNIVADPPTIRITNLDKKTNVTTDFNVILTDNVNFQNLITLQQSNFPLNITVSDMTNLIVQEINKQAKGVGTTYNIGNTFSIVNEIDGWKISNVTIITKKSNPTILSVFNDPYNGQLPTSATIGGLVTPFGTGTIGYVYDRTSSSTFHIQVDYDIINNVPIWYTISEKKLVISVDYMDSFPYITYAENLNSVVYLNDTRVSFRQLWQNSTLLNLIQYAGLPLSDTLQDLVTQEQEKMFQRFITSWQKTFDFYNLDLYEENGEICVSRKFTSYDDPNTADIDSKYDYVDVTFNSIRYDSGTSGDVLNAEHLVPVPVEEDIRVCYQFEVVETLQNEFNQNWGLRKKPTSENWQRKIIIDFIDSSFGLTVTINGVSYEINFDDIVTINDQNKQLWLDVEQTLKDFGLKRFSSEQTSLTPNLDSEIGLKYYEQLESLGVIVTLQKAYDHGGFSYAGTSGYVPYDTLVITSKYPNNAITFSISGTNNQHKILHSSVEFITIQNTLAITINGFRYSANGTNVYVILQNWLSLHSVRLFDLDIVVEYVDTNTLRFSTLKSTTPLVYQIYVGRNPVIGEILYNVKSFQPGYTGIILSSNQIIDTTGGFEANNFATGMLVNVTQSKWPLNNQRYNILFVDPTKLVLSYQGPFWTESDIFGDINNRWLGLYNFSWENFRDPNIFFTFELVGYTQDNTSTTGVVVKFIDQSTISDPVQWIWDFGDGSTYTAIDQQPTPSESSSGYSYQNPRYPTHTFSKVGKYVVQLIIIDSSGIAHSNSELITLSLDGSTSGIDFGNHLSLITHEFLRYPRENYNENTPIVKYHWRWSDNSDESIFYYDFSGSQLTDQGTLTYVGTKPLISDAATGVKIFLNDTINKDITAISDPSRQQTVFDDLTYELPKVDSEIDISFEPEPMQVFIGYRSDVEGVNTRTVVLEKIEDISIKMVTQKTDPYNVQVDAPVTLYKNVVYIFPDIAELRVENFDNNFIDLNFKPGQVVQIVGQDNVNQFGQIPFKNNGKIVEISQVGVNWLRFKDASLLVSECSWQQAKNYRSPYNIISVSFDITIELQPIEIAKITLSGQTEIEDPRYKIITQNNGYNVKPNDTFIFSDYDVEEHGIDWIFLNSKRKELIVNSSQIYNYIGSYKAIINAINFFGYNDLQFFEYYRNIDSESKQYGKLYKVEIANIFNNLVPGFQVNDFILGTLPNKKYNKTNMFNLTYQITDFDGNSVLAYTLDEVIIKLQGLKKWLQKETIPIGKRILDITGHTQVREEVQISHDLKQVISIDVTNDLTPVNFKTEAYLQPVINNSETYNVHIEFFTEKDVIPDYFELKIQTFTTLDDFRKQPFNMRPVQIIKEFKTDMRSYNFAADVNVDPFIMIETTTQNGYGEIFTKRRTYSLQSLAFL